MTPFYHKSRSDRAKSLGIVNDNACQFGRDGSGPSSVLFANLGFGTRSEHRISQSTQPLFSRAHGFRETRCVLDSFLYPLRHEDRNAVAPQVERAAMIGGGADELLGGANILHHVSRAARLAEVLTVIEQLETGVRIRRVWMEVRHPEQRELLARTRHANEVEISNEPPLCSLDQKPVIAREIAAVTEIENIRLDECAAIGNLVRLDQINADALPAASRKGPRPAEASAKQVKQSWHPASPFVSVFSLPSSWVSAYTPAPHLRSGLVPLESFSSCRQPFVGNYILDSLGVHVRHSDDTRAAFTLPLIRYHSGIRCFLRSCARVRV